MNFTDIYFFDKLMAENPERVYISLAVAVLMVVGSIVYEIAKARKDG